MRRVILCLLAFALAAGCGGKDPVGPKGGAPVPTYSDRSDPKGTVTDYALAWEKRDSVQIGVLLADDYQGTSTDIGPVTETLTFVKSDEVRALHHLRDDPNVAAVEVSMGPSSSWVVESQPADPPEWVTITTNNVNIRLAFSSGADLASRTSCSFKLKPVASGSDTTWSIVRWSEVHQSL